MLNFCAERYINVDILNGRWLNLPVILFQAFVSVPRPISWLQLHGIIRFVLRVFFSFLVLSVISSYLMVNILSILINLVWMLFIGKVLGDFTEWSCCSQCPQGINLTRPTGKYMVVRKSHFCH